MEQRIVPTKDVLPNVHMGSEPTLRLNDATRERADGRNSLAVVSSHSSSKVEDSDACA
jgi:hypothetical protein